MHRRTRPLTAVLVGLALLLGAACGDEDPITADAEGPANTVDPVSDVEETDDGIAVAGCEQLEQRPDGVYSIGDAGEVEVGDGGEVLDVRPAEDWDVVDEGDGELTLSDGEREIDVTTSVVEDEVFVEFCES